MGAGEWNENASSLRGSRFGARLAGGYSYRKTVMGVRPEDCLTPRYRSVS
jgi:hypothetical protein